MCRISVKITIRVKNMFNLLILVIESKTRVAIISATCTRFFDCIRPIIIIRTFIKDSRGSNPEIKLLLPLKAAAHQNLPNLRPACVSREQGKILFQVRCGKKCTENNIILEHFVRIVARICREGR